MQHRYTCSVLNQANVTLNTDSDSLLVSAASCKRTYLIIFTVSISVQHRIIRYTFPFKIQSFTTTYHNNQLHTVVGTILQIQYKYTITLT